MSNTIPYESMVSNCLDFFTNRWHSPPEIVIILGTGQELMPPGFKQIDSIPYSSIPHFPQTSVESHTGMLIYGEINGKIVALLLGRFHYYEGYSLKEVTFPIRVLAELGCKIVLLTNAAGGLNLQYKCGSLMIITDHLNLIGMNPLRGENNNQYGPRFPDMSEPYSHKLIELADQCAQTIDIKINKGVYIAIQGPSLETKAETKFYRNCGADAIGMSTVPEVIVAKHAGMEVLAISIIANVNDPDNFQPILVEDVIKQVKAAEPDCLYLISELVRNIEC